MSCLLNTSPNRVSLHNILAHAKITTTCFALFSAIRALKSKSLAPTTIRKKLVDVVVFAKWLKRTSTGPALVEKGYVRLDNAYAMNVFCAHRVFCHQRF